MTTESKPTPILKFDSKSIPGSVIVHYDGQTIGFIFKDKAENAKKVPAHTHRFVSSTPLLEHLTGPGYVEVRDEVRKRLS